MTSQKGFAPLIIVFILAAVGLVAIGYALGTNKLSMPIESSEPVPSASATPVATLKPITGAAEENNVYFGLYEGAEAIFVNNNITKIDGSGVQKVTVQSLRDAKKIWADDKYRIESVARFGLDKSNNIFISLLLSDKGSDYTVFPLNKVYKVSLVSGEAEELWSHQIGADSPTGGAYYIDKVSDDGKYIVGEMGVCWACDGGIAGVMVINTTTGKTKFVEDIGNVSLDSAKVSFSYQKLMPFKEPCDDGYGCEADGYRTVMEPAGETYTEALP